MGTELKIVEIAIAVGFAAVGGAVGYGMLRQQVASLRRDHEKLDGRVTDIDKEQRDTNGELFRLLNGMNRNLHRLMGKLDVEPVD